MGGMWTRRAFLGGLMVAGAMPALAEAPQRSLRPAARPPGSPAIRQGAIKVLAQPAEELIAAAHASCFTMALSLILGEAKLTAEELETSAEVTLEQVEGGWAITAIHLTLTGKVPGADQATFGELAGRAKANCPVSKLLKANITLDTTLVT